MTATPMREAAIDVSAIAHNVARLREVAGTRELIAVVKADGYGHGAERAARAALRGGATRLGVADVDEALRLREAGVDAPIVAWLHGEQTRFDAAVAAHVELGVSSQDELRRVAAASSGDRPAIVHLKLETGLGRNGVPPAAWGDVCAAAARLEEEGVLRVDGLFSHLANASAEDDRAALDAFLDGVAAASRAGLTPRIRHLAATEGAFARPDARLDAVRVGIGVYGLSPFADRDSADLGLRPAMTLRAAVAAVRRVPAGHGVSYGYDYRVPRETTLALVPLGYADGVPRQASGRDVPVASSAVDDGSRPASSGGPVTIRGARFLVAGRVAMDQFVVDVGDRPVAVGDEAVLFGDPVAGAPSATEWADAAGTINYEIVTRIGRRVPRRDA